MKHMPLASAILLLLTLAGLLVPNPARAGAVEGDSPHGPLALECGACHTTAGWTQLKTPPDFNHTTTAFPLAGRHAGVACVACHPEPRL